MSLFLLMIPLGCKGMQRVINLLVPVTYSHGYIRKRTTEQQDRKYKHFLQHIIQHFSVFTALKHAKLLIASIDRKKTSFRATFDGTFSQDIYKCN